MVRIRDDYAIRLLISLAPTVSWTMAVPPGDDVRLLRDGECFGLDVDSGGGCFVDVGHRNTLGQRFSDEEFVPACAAACSSSSVSTVKVGPHS